MAFYPIKKVLLWNRGEWRYHLKFGSIFLVTALQVEIKRVMIGPKRSLHLQELYIVWRNKRLFNSQGYSIYIYNNNQADSAQRVKESAYNLKLGKDQSPFDLLRCKEDNLIWGCLPFQIY